MTSPLIFSKSNKNPWILYISEHKKILKGGKKEADWLGTLGLEKFYGSEFSGFFFFLMPHLSNWVLEKLATQNL